MNNTSSSEPITIEETQKILEQMTNCICKVKSKGIYGTGFFCRIRFLDNTFIKVLTTSYQILDEHYFKENNEINLIINNQARIINLNKKRKIYSNKDFDLTLIEIKESDKINDYFELDENILSQENPKLFYENKTIYIIQYLNMEKASVSYGIFNDLIDSEIKHTCSTKPGSNCSPILNSMNNKIIGISKVIKGKRESNEALKELLKIMNEQRNYIENISEEHLMLEKSVSRLITSIDILKTKLNVKYDYNIDTNNIKNANKVQYKPNDIISFAKLHNNKKIMNHTFNKKLKVPIKKGNVSSSNRYLSDKISLNSYSVTSTNIDYDKLIHMSVTDFKKRKLKPINKKK